MNMDDIVDLDTGEILDLEEYERRETEEAQKKLRKYKYLPVFDKEAVTCKEDLTKRLKQVYKRGVSLKRWVDVSIVFQMGAEEVRVLAELADKVAYHNYSVVDLKGIFQKLEISRSYGLRIVKKLENRNYLRILKVIDKDLKLVQTHPTLDWRGADAYRDQALRSWYVENKRK